MGKRIVDIVCSCVHIRNEQMNTQISSESEHLFITIIVINHSLKQSIHALHSIVRHITNATHEVAVRMPRNQRRTYKQLSLCVWEWRKKTFTHKEDRSTNDAILDTILWRENVQKTQAIHSLHTHTLHTRLHASHYSRLLWKTKKIRNFFEGYTGCLVMRTLVVCLCMFIIIPITRFQRQCWLAYTTWSKTHTYTSPRICMCHAIQSTENNYSLLLLLVL